MLKVLLIKTSSLGDVVHNLPVASDIRRRFPDALIEWAVEEDYVPLVRLHSAVANVIPVAIRRWRRRPLGGATWDEVGQLRRLFRDERYDAVIDTQGLIKSAILARAAQGRRHGFDAGTAREGLAARFYDVTHHVSRAQHAVARNRILAGGALGYRPEPAPDYGIGARHGARASERYAVLLHATSRADKLWPVPHWIELGQALEDAGVRSIVPWGNDEERSRSDRIAAGLRHAAVPPKAPLGGVVGLLTGAQAVIGVDTGLTHLAAALGTPVVALFRGSDPALTGVFGVTWARNLGSPGIAPDPAAVLQALRELGVG